MKQLLRKKDIVDAVGVPKSTVSDWINDYPAFIPTVKDGASTYYKTESVEVLLYIKELRELNFSKPEIASKLAEKGFAINAEEVAGKLIQTKEKSLNSDALNTVMTTMGKFLEKSIAQDGRIGELEKSIRSGEEQRRQSESEIAASQEILMQKLEHQEQELQKLRKTLEEERKKTIWSKLFGK